MKRIRNGLSVLLLVIGLFRLNACQENRAPGFLRIDYIEFRQTGTHRFLDLPDGTYIPDDPNFHPDRPETWTGNMAKYVSHIYYYDITYQITNSGASPAFSTELDLYLSYLNGDEEVRTLYIGDIASGITLNRTAGASSVNTQLVGCDGEVFWWD